jgi:hypothetical protein
MLKSPPIDNLQNVVGNTDKQPLKLSCLTKRSIKTYNNYLQTMRRFKKLLIFILLIPLFNIIFITAFNGLIEVSWWKYSRGADFKDFLEFDETLQAKSILIQKDGKTEKIIFIYLFDYMILSDKDFTNWTYYVRKGEKHDANETAKPHETHNEITGTSGDKKLLDSLMKNRK